MLSKYLNVIVLLVVCVWEKITRTAALGCQGRVVGLGQGCGIPTSCSGWGIKAVGESRWGLVAKSHPHASPSAFPLSACFLHYKMEILMASTLGGCCELIELKVLKIGLLSSRREDLL